MIELWIYLIERCCFSTSVSHYFIQQALVKNPLYRFCFIKLLSFNFSSVMALLTFILQRLDSRTPIFKLPQKAGVQGSLSFFIGDVVCILRKVLCFSHFNSLIISMKRKSKKCLWVEKIKRSKQGGEKERIYIIGRTDTVWTAILTELYFQKCCQIKYLLLCRPKTLQRSIFF